MIESVIPMDFPFLDQGHGSEVFLLPGLVRQPGISPGDLKARMAKKLMLYKSGLTRQFDQLFSPEAIQ